MKAKKAISPDQFIQFNELLEYLRRREGLTQRELSVRVGYSDSQISRLEHNQRIPDREILMARFVPALYLEYEPEWTARLLELADNARLAKTPENQHKSDLNSSNDGPSPEAGLIHERLHIQLLGGFGIRYGEEPVQSLKTRRLQTLLTYLVLNANLPQSRQHVAFQLWPDTTEANAHNNLRQFLHQLRRSLPHSAHFLEADTTTVCWRQDESQLIDVLRFERAIQNAESAEQQADFSAAVGYLKEASATYRGDLLPGCYDEWISPYRDRFRLGYWNANQKMVSLLEQQHNYPAALQAAQALQRLDPLDESTYLTTMRLHELNHDYGAARRTYQTAVETLQRELGVEPGELLRLAFQKIQQLSEPPDPEHMEPLLTLVGRQAEWRQLQATWQHALRGNAHFVLITGEAGIGKSRLAEELYNWASQRGFTTAYSRSYAAEGRMSLAPVTDWLRSPRILPYLSQLNKTWLTEVTRLIPELLSKHENLARPGPIGEYGQRQRFFEALARAVLAASRPILLWIDDLQWCDPETLEWLHFLLRFEPHTRLLVLGTARIEESLPDHPLVKLTRQLLSESSLTSIELTPLDASDSRLLASQITEGELDDADALVLYHETEGNPLFVVETVRARIANGVGEGRDIASQEFHQGHALPPRVYAVINGRLAQLSSQARRVAEFNAAFGREFSLEILIRTGLFDETEAVSALDELWQKRIIREQSANIFDFTHDKIREVAYAETSAPQRRLLHRHIAQALENINADGLDLVSAQVAVHYEQAGMYARALPFYQRAGEVAASIYANEDAINQYSRGLSLLTHILPGTKRDKQELDLQLALATLYRISKGWASPEVDHALTRAMLLSEKVGDAEKRIRTLFGLQLLYVVRGSNDKVLQTHAQVQKLYYQTNGKRQLPFIEINLAGAKLMMGQIKEASELFENIVALREDKNIRDLQESQGMNYLVHGLAWNAHGTWCLGYPRRALNGARAAIEFAREFVQPFNQALAATYLALIQEWCLGPVAFRPYAEHAHNLATEYHVLYYLAWANILLCFGNAWQQPDSAHLNQLDRAIRDFTDTGAHIRLPLYYTLLARACQRAGAITAALEAIEAGMAEALQNNERWWDAELHRLRGELIRFQGADPDEIEMAFQRSLEIAQSQQAKSLELRAATSLARHWLAAGRSEKAKQLLLPLFGWFSEGHDTLDVKEAKSLIEIM